MKQLFTSIPNIKSLFKATDGNEPFPSKLEPIVPSAGRVNPIVGHGYDYLLRAFVQRINGIHQEHGGDLAASIGVRLLAERGIHVQGAYADILQRRHAYISGLLGIDTQLIRDSMVLGTLDSCYRSGYISDRGILNVNDSDKADLERLIRATEAHTELFKAKNIECNPMFGEAVTQLVDGAEADLILDDMLIDLKTESTFGYKIGHVRQLIGYWILGCLTPSYRHSIKRIGIWNSRYCRLVYVTLEDVCRSMDMMAFTEKFVGIITHLKFEGSSHLPRVLRERIMYQ